MFGQDIIEEWTFYRSYKLHINLSELSLDNVPENKIIISNSWTKDYFFYLYNSVGKKYNWWYMHYLDSIDVDKFLSGNKLYITFIIDGQPAGFSIINFENCYIEYFGLFEHFTGKSLSKSFLNACLAHARSKVSELFLYTNSFDHPAAMPLYLKSGFKILETRKVGEYYPTSFLN